MTRDPRTDPQPGDILRDSRDDFPVKVLRCEGDSIVVDIGAAECASMTLARWLRWAGRKRAVTVQVVADEEQPGATPNAVMSPPVV